MKRLGFVVGACLSVALLAACGGGTPYSGPNQNAPKKIIVIHYQVLHSFTGSPNDGANPNYGPPIIVGEILYGTTINGGSSGNTCPSSNYSAIGCGTVYEINLNGGAESVLYNLGSGNVAEHPWSGLVYLNGVFYGTTFNGGTTSYCSFHSILGCGTIFEAYPSGGGNVDYSFQGGADGQFPQASLVIYNSALYGVTNSGGTYGAGTIFSYAPSVGKQTRASFDDLSCPSGSCTTTGGGPEAPLLFGPTGFFGGMTESGGGTKCKCGAIYEFVPNGSGLLTGVYSFRGAPNAGGNQGAGAALIEIGHVLYGTTVAGGDKACASTNSAGGGCGVVFSYDLYTEKEHVLFAFTGKNGAFPLGGVVELNGKLYGTTQQGGANGLGTVFQIDPNSGAEKVEHSFSGGSDGAFPQAGLLASSNGVLFGTTVHGGAAGEGTVFSVIP